MSSGRAECMGCFERFSKNEMDKLTWHENSGYSVGLMGIGSKRKTGSIRQYFRKRTGWICENCNSRRKYYVVSLILLVFGGFIGLHALYGGRILKMSIYLVLATFGLEFIIVFASDKYFGLIEGDYATWQVLDFASIYLQQEVRFTAFLALSFLLFIDAVKHLTLQVRDPQGVPYRLI